MRGSLAVLLLLTLAAAADRRPHKPARFALELKHQNAATDYIVVEDGGGDQVVRLMGPNLRRLSTARTPQALPSIVRLTISTKSDAVVVAAEAVFTGSAPTALGSAESRPLGEFTATLGQNFTIWKLHDYDIEPLTFTVVTARPDVPTNPLLVNRVGSVLFELSDEDRANIYLRVKNLSTKTLLGLLIDAPAQQGRTTESMSTFHPLESGESEEVRFACPKVGINTRTGFVQDSDACQLRLRAALFQDGSGEGDEDALIKLREMKTHAHLGAPYDDNDSKPISTPGHGVPAPPQ